MKKRIVIIVLAVLVCVSAFFIRKHIVGVQGEERLIWYQKAVEGEFTNRIAQDVLDRFGKPETIYSVENGELWRYGPALDDLINAKDGDVVGITVHVNKYGGVIGCSGSRKTESSNQRKSRTSHE